jgi:hypothetical protein
MKKAHAPMACATIDAFTSHDNKEEQNCNKRKLLIPLLPITDWPGETLKEGIRSFSV